MSDASPYKHRVSIKKTIAQPNSVLRGQFDASPILGRLKNYLSSQHNPSEINDRALEAEVISQNQKEVQKVKLPLKSYNQSF